MTDIDPRLADLIREAAAKLDALESPQHMQEVALLRELDNRRVSVAEAVQTRIIEATAAQQAVLNYRAGMDDLPELDDMVHSYAEEPEDFMLPVPRYVFHSVTLATASSIAEAEAAPSFEPNTAFDPIPANGLATT